jgi:hypothetical protein
MRVDEPRGDDLACGVDPQLGVGMGKLSDGRDAIAARADVGLIPGKPAAVHDPAAGDECVEHEGSLWRKLWRGRCGEREPT